MTIRTKLTLNVLLVAAVVAAVAGTSLLGIGFIKGRLSLLTRHSTPFQIRTLQLQRDVQTATSDLLRLADAPDPEAFAQAEAAAQSSVAAARESQQALAAISGEGGAASAELGALFDELSAVVGDRVRAQGEAREAGGRTAEELEQILAGLRELDARVKELQVAESRRYVGVVEEGQRLSEDLRSIEVLRTTLKDIDAAALQLQGGPPARWQDAFASLARRAKQNGFAKRHARLKDEVPALVGRVEELARLRGQEPFGKKLSDFRRHYDAVMEALQDESDAGNEAFADAYGKQRDRAARAATAVDALSSNSALVSLGVALDGRVGSLFTAARPEDLDQIAADVAATFDQMEGPRGKLLQALKTLQAARDLEAATAAFEGLAGVRETLQAGEGLVVRLRRSLQMRARSAETTSRLRDIVRGQLEQGKLTVSSAQTEQEASVAAVDRVAALSTTLIAAIGALAVVVGIGFGVWIYRSVAAPLAALAVATEQVAAGDLTLRLQAGGADEVGRVLGAMARMVESLRQVLQRIKAVTQALASSSEELSATAQHLESGSAHQQARVDQSAAAAEEMSKTNLEVARNSAQTSAAADRMHQSAGAGKTSMHTTAERLNRFVEEVRRAADTVHTLGQQSKEIDAVVALIRDVADQTNLLALNAAIEAARAGPQGRGFAVVADSVRELAEKTMAAVADISKTVRNMQGGVTQSVAAMAEQRRTAEEVLADVGQTLASIDDISAEVGQVSEMIRQIAVAAEEQSSTSEEISANMDGITGVTAELRRGFSEVQTSSGILARMASELESLVGWFRV